MSRLNLQFDSGLNWHDTYSNRPLAHIIPIAILGSFIYISRSHGLHSARTTTSPDWPNINAFPSTVMMDWPSRRIHGMFLCGFVAIY